MDQADRRVVQCNYSRPNSAVADGARAYVITVAHKDRVDIVVRSRSGRWIRKWESVRHLTDFRVKTLPPEHPMYGDERLRDIDVDRLAGNLRHVVSG